MLSVFLAPQDSLLPPAFMECLFEPTKTTVHVGTESPEYKACPIGGMEGEERGSGHLPVAGNKVHHEYLSVPLALLSTFCCTHPVFARSSGCSMPNSVDQRD